MEMKKVAKSILRLIIILALIVFIVWGAFLLRKNYLLDKLENLANETAKTTNYYYSIEIYNDKTISSNQYWIKEDAFLAKLNLYENKQESTAVVYSKKADYLMLLNQKEEKIYSTKESKDKVVKIRKLSEFYPDVYEHVRNKGVTILEDRCNEKECYLLLAKNADKFWVEKETGIVVQMQISDMLVKFSYILNDVKDIEKPNTAGYKLVN